MATLIPRAQQFISASLANRTKKTYASAWKSYCSFCSSNCLHAIPFLENNIILFFTHLAGRSVSHNSLKVYLSALTFHGSLLGSPLIVRDMPLLYHTLRGIKRTQGNQLIRPRRNPINIQHMLRLRQYLFNYIPVEDGVMLSCAASLAFFGLMRSAEYVSPSSTTFNPDTLLFTDLTISNDHSRLFINLRVSKNDPFRQGTIIRLFKLDSPLCPVLAVERYFSIIPSISGPLFIFQNGSFLTRNFMSQLLKSALPNVPALNTHSFRIGGASAASSHGIPDSIVQVLGRWSSDCFRQYIRISDKDMSHYQQLLATASTNNKLWDSDNIISD